MTDTSTETPTVSEHELELLPAGIRLSGLPTSGPPAAPSDVAAVVPGVWTDDQCNAAVSWALSQVEDYCNRHFAAQTLTTRLYPDDLLPSPPVTAVNDVQGFIALPGQQPQWVELVNYGWTPGGLIYDTSVVRGGPWAPTWPTLPASLKVNYTRGFTMWPQPVVDAVKALAALYVINPIGMSEMRTAEVMRRWYTGGATANGTSGSGQGAGGIGTQAALDRLVLVEVS